MKVSLFGKFGMRFICSITLALALIGCTNTSTTKPSPLITTVHQIATNPVITAAASTVPALPFILSLIAAATGGAVTHKVITRSKKTTVTDTKDKTPTTTANAPRLAS